MVILRRYRFREHRWALFAIFFSSVSWPRDLAAWEEHHCKNLAKNTYTAMGANKINPVIAECSELNWTCTWNQNVKCTPIYICYTLTAFHYIILQVHKQVNKKKHSNSQSVLWQQDDFRIFVLKLDTHWWIISAKLAIISSYHSFLGILFIKIPVFFCLYSSSSFLLFWNCASFNLFIIF